MFVSAADTIWEVYCNKVIPGTTATVLNVQLPCNERLDLPIFQIACLSTVLYSEMLLLHLVVALSAGPWISVGSCWAPTRGQSSGAGPGPPPTPSQ